MPSQPDFPPGNDYACACAAEGDVYAHLNKALQQLFFGDGLSPKSVSSPWIGDTPFRSVEVPAPRRAKIALQLTWPVRLQDGKLGFRISKIAKEGRGGSPLWFDVTTKQIQEKVDEFLHKFLAETQE